MIAAPLVAVDLYDDRACNTPTLLGRFVRGHGLVTCQARWSRQGSSLLRMEVPVNHPHASALARGLILRTCTSSAADFDEWIIDDIEDGFDADLPPVIVTARSMDADLDRALYASHTAEVAALDLVMDGATIADVIDGPVIAEALAQAGITHISRGSVVAHDPFDLRVPVGTSARGLLNAAADATGTEWYLARNGTTDYQIVFVSQVGADKPDLYLRARRNLVSLARQQRGVDLANRVVGLGREAGVSRLIAFASWEVVDRDTSDDYVVLADPRGSGFAGPIWEDDQFVGGYLAVEGATFASYEILDTVAATQRVYVADASLIPVGSRVHFRLASGSDGTRQYYVEHPGSVAAIGVQTRVPQFDDVTGAQNYASDAFFEDTTGTVAIQIGGNITCSTASATVSGSGTQFLNSVSVGETLRRNSDDAVIGVIQSIESNTSLTLEANAAVTIAVNAAANVVKAISQGWTYTATGGSNILHVVEPAPSALVRNGTQSFHIVRSAVGTSARYRSPTLAAQTDRAWRFWLTFHKTGAGPIPTVALVRANDSAELADPVSFGSSATLEGTFTAEFVAPDISSATSGVELQLRIASGGGAFDLYLDSWGMAPAEWELYETRGFEANDCWTKAQQWLADHVGPAGYTLRGRDYRFQNPTDVSEALFAPGQTVHLWVPDLGITATQRLEEFTCDYLRDVPADLVIGERPQTAAEAFAAQLRKERATVTSAIVGAIQSAVQAGALSSLSVQLPVLDEDGLETGSTAQIDGNTFGGVLVRAFVSAT